MLDSRRTGNHNLPSENDKVLSLTTDPPFSRLILNREQYLQRRDHGETVSGLHVNPDRNNIPRGKSKMVIFVTLPLAEVVKGVAVEGMRVDYFVV